MTSCRTCQYFHPLQGTPGYGTCGHEKRLDVMRYVDESDTCDEWQLWTPTRPDGRIKVCELDMGEPFTRAGSSEVYIRGQMYNTDRGVVIRLRDGLVLEIWKEELIFPIKGKFVEEGCEE